MRPIRSWPKSAWAGMPKSVMTRRGRPGRLARPWPGRPLRSLLHERALALVERAKRLRGGDDRALLVVVPRGLRLGRLLHLEQEHVVDLPAVGPDRALPEERVVGGHLLHLRDHLAAVVGLERLHRLQVV